MLLSGQVDAVIADAMIFQHYNRALLDGKGPLPVFTDAFEPTCYAVVFRNADYRDAFDRGLSEMIRGNLLERIDEKYIQSSGLGSEIHYAEDGKEPCSN
jgi:ABC-type amino acid transport substrate-binding protein